MKTTTKLLIAVSLALVAFSFSASPVAATSADTSCLNGPEPLCHEDLSVTMVEEVGTEGCPLCPMAVGPITTDEPITAGEPITNEAPITASLGVEGCPLCPISADPITNDGPSTSSDVGTQEECQVNDPYSCQY